MRNTRNKLLKKSGRKMAEKWQENGREFDFPRVKMRVWKIAHKVADHSAAFSFSPTHGREQNEEKSVEAAEKLRWLDQRAAPDHLVGSPASSGQADGGCAVMKWINRLVRRLAPFAGPEPRNRRERRERRKSYR